MKGHTYKRCPCGVVRDADGKRINCRKKHGSWYYAHELPPGANRRRRQVFRGGFPTEKDAGQALSEAIAAVGNGTRLEPTTIRVGEYLDQWLAAKAGLRATTRRSYSSHIELYLRPTLGHLQLSELRDVHVERLYAVLPLLGRDSAGPRPDEVTRLLAARTGSPPVRPLGPATIRRIHATVMSALNNAVRRRLIPRNPAEYVELPRARRPRAVVWTDERVADWEATGRRPPVAVWTPEQAGAFLDAATQDRLYPLFHLIAYRGLRRGEAVGVRWTNLDMAGARLTISEQIVQLGWETEEAPPKTDSGERVVTLDAETLRILQEWRTRQDEEARHWGPAWERTGLIFTTEAGNGLHPATATDRFHRIAEAAGLPPIRLHDLRHTAASLALQAGVPMKVVSEQLGHSSLAITADTYTSVLPAVATAAAQSVADVVPRRTRVTDRARAVQAKPIEPAVAAPNAPALAIRWHSLPPDDARSGDTDENEQVRGSGPRGDRTHNPRIKSPLLCRLS